MQRKKILDGAGVLLIAIVMVLSTVAVTAHTNQNATSIRSIAEPNNVITPTQPTQTMGRDTLYDNGAVDGLTGLSCGAFQGYNREIIDDFVVPVTWHWQVTGGEYSVIVDSGGTSITGCIVSFFQDTGTGPSMTAYATTTATITQVLTGAVYFDRPEIRVTCSFDAVALASGTWWVGFQTQHTENCFSLTASVQVSPVYCALPDIGYPRWTPCITVFRKNYDLSWLLTGTGSNPPNTPVAPSGPDNGFTDIEYQFTASTTDPDGDNIFYMFDWGDGHNSGWVGPYVSGTPAHASHTWAASEDYQVKVKAKDENNAESKWSPTHTISIVDRPLLEVGNISGGLFKVSTTIKNTGCVDATMVSWSITLDGGVILLGKETTGNILSLPAGDEAKISSNVLFGFGNTVITVSAECDESLDTKEQDAFVFLFFIIV